MFCSARINVKHTISDGTPTCEHCGKLNPAVSGQLQQPQVTENRNDGPSGSVPQTAVAPSLSLLSAQGVSSVAPTSLLASENTTAIEALSLASRSASPAASAGDAFATHKAFAAALAQNRRASRPISQASSGSSTPISGTEHNLSVTSSGNKRKSKKKNSAPISDLSIGPSLSFKYLKVVCGEIGLDIVNDAKKLAVVGSQEWKPAQNILQYVVEHRTYWPQTIYHNILLSAEPFKRFVNNYQREHDVDLSPQLCECFFVAEFSRTAGAISLDPSWEYLTTLQSVLEHHYTGRKTVTVIFLWSHPISDSTTTHSPEPIGPPTETALQDNNNIALTPMDEYLAVEAARQEMPLPSTSRKGKEIALPRQNTPSSELATPLKAKRSRADMKTPSPEQSKKPHPPLQPSTPVAKRTRSTVSIDTNSNSNLPAMPNEEQSMSPTEVDSDSENEPESTHSSSELSEPESVSQI